MSTIQYSTHDWSGAMPATYAPRLVADFLDRHGAGLQDICARVGRDAEQRLAAVRSAVSLTPAQPTALADTLEALAECLDAAHGHDDVPTRPGLPHRPDLDAAIRWNVAKLHVLAVFCRRL
jgi:hypothetical protein